MLKGTKVWRNYINVLYISLFIIIIYSFIVTFKYEELRNKYHLELEKELPYKLATGCYFPSENYFCVYIKGRDWSKVMETCSHEYLHYKYDDHWD